MFEYNLENEIVFFIKQDEFSNGAYHIQLTRDVEVLSSLHLVPLQQNQVFTENDFYQKTFSSYPKQNGYGRLLLNTLLNNIRNEIPNCHNIYSTSWLLENNFNATDFITTDVVALWESLVRDNIAERNEQLNRYKLLLPEM